MARWAYGVMTCSSRLQTTLPLTLDSLSSGGFSCPRLFVDSQKIQSMDLLCDATIRYPQVGAYCNWLFSLYELYGRDHKANRYVVFQDDIIVCKNLRPYLDVCKFPKDGYWNLMSFMSNEPLLEGREPGWLLSDQMGRSAVGMVFSRSALQALLQSSEVVMKLAEAGWRRTQKIDQVVIQAMKRLDYKEYIHNPSLVQHIGDTSAIGNQPHPKALTFPGTDFDAMDLTRSGHEVPLQP